MALSKSRVTIRDVAERANVTAQTVSRVMRGKGYVAEDTRKCVLSAAKELKYIPSYVAKALRNGMSRSIAVVFDSLRNIYFSVMIDHLRQAIIDYGYSVQLIFSDDVVITESCYRKAISHGAVAVISFLEGDADIGDAVDDCGVPLMIFGRSAADERLDYITTDDKQGGELVARRLLEQGCTKFKYLVEGSGLTCALDRYEGFSTELKKHGYDVEIIDTGYAQDVYSLIDFDDPSVGVFCFNDILAFHLIKQMTRVPLEQRSKVVGYDNIQSDIVLPISLTTVGVDKPHHAKYAIDSIVAKLSDPTVRFAVREKVELFDGETA